MWVCDNFPRKHAGMYKRREEWKGVKEEERKEGEANGSNIQRKLRKEGRHGDLYCIAAIYVGT